MGRRVSPVADSGRRAWRAEGPRGPAGGERPIAPVEIDENVPDSAGPLTAFAIRGHLAIFAGVGKKLQWDVEKMGCADLPPR